MRVAAVQFTGSTHEHARALGRLVQVAHQAADGADLVVLPELAATNYLFAGPVHAGRVAEPAAGRTFAALAPVAREHGSWLVAGFVERARDRLFNSALIIDPRGELAFCYRKTLLFVADETWAAPGDSGYRRFDTEHGSFTVGICMDLNDDGFTRWCRTSGADVIAFPTNWLEEGLDVWEYWGERTEGAGALVAANKFGVEGPIAYCGRSAVLQGGSVLAAAPSMGECLVRGSLTGVRTASPPLGAGRRDAR